MFRRNILVHIVVVLFAAQSALTACKTETNYQAGQQAGQVVRGARSGSQPGGRRTRGDVMRQVLRCRAGNGPPSRVDGQILMKDLRAEVHRTDKNETRKMKSTQLRVMSSIKGDVVCRVTYVVCMPLLYWSGVSSSVSCVPLQFLNRRGR